MDRLRPELLTNRRNSHVIQNFILFRDGLQNEGKK